MRLHTLRTHLTEKQRSENSTLDQTPAPGDTGEYISTAQAAKILGVTQSRVRQFIMDGRLSSKDPKKGRRDNMLLASAVRSFAKKDRERTGRPDERENKEKKD